MTYIGSCALARTRSTSIGAGSAADVERERLAADVGDEPGRDQHGISAGGLGRHAERVIGRQQKRRHSATPRASQDLADRRAAGVHEQDIGSRSFHGLFHEPQERLTLPLVRVVRHAGGAPVHDNRDAVIVQAKAGRAALAEGFKGTLQAAEPGGGVDLPLRLDDGAGQGLNSDPLL